MSEWQSVSWVELHKKQKIRLAVKLRIVGIVASLIKISKD